MRRLRLTYWIVLALLSLGAAVKVVVGEANQGHLAVVALLTGVGALLGWLTFRIAASRMREPIKTVLAVVVGYHALFGPVMLAYILSVDASRNDDLALQLYPHVIEFINSFE